MLIPWQDWVGDPLPTLGWHLAGSGQLGDLLRKGASLCLKDPPPPDHLRAWAGPDLGGTSLRGHSQGQAGPSLAARVGSLHFTHAVWRSCTLVPIVTPRKLRCTLPDLLPPIMRLSPCIPLAQGERRQARRVAVSVDPGAGLSSSVTLHPLLHFPGPVSPSVKWA